MVKTLGQRIRELREAADLSLRELSKRISGASAAFLSDVELGRRHPAEKTLANIAKGLGTTVEDLQQYDSRPPIKEMRRQAAENPAVGIAFRRIAELSPDEVLKIAEEIGKRSGKKK
jgi:transcriptional regulator with XRE-family HTH domain